VGAVSTAAEAVASAAVVSADSPVVASADSTVAALVASTVVAPDIMAAILTDTRSIITRPIIIRTTVTIHTVGSAASWRFLAHGCGGRCVCH